MYFLIQNIRFVHYENELQKSQTNLNQDYFHVKEEKVKVENIHFEPVNDFEKVR